MQWKKIVIAASVLGLLMAALVPQAMAQELVVVASQATYDASQKWVGFLQTKQVPMKHVTPQKFAADKEAEYVLVVGGLDDPDIKALAQEALTAGQLEWVMQEGNGNMYERENVWGSGQVVMLIVGSDWPAAELARKDTREGWSEAFEGWFDVDMGKGLFGAY